MANNKRVLDGWLLFLKVSIVLAYVSLIVIKPSGESWGRGWNLVAYWFYLTPTILLVGGLHAWLQKAGAIQYRRIDFLALFAAFIFPIMSIIVFKFKS